MWSWTRTCLQATLKLVNSMLGFVGMGMILYSLWILRVWFKHSLPDSASPVPWFMYTFFGLGITLCLITCSGHVAAETANSHCLSCYMVFVSLLVMVEAGITADIFLNRYWEADFPDDPTGRFEEFKEFVRSNFELCKWIGLLIVAVQAMSIFLALLLRVLGQSHVAYYESDDDYIPTTLPLLKDQVRQNSRIGDYNLPPKDDSCNVRIS